MAFETKTENPRALGFVLSEAEFGRSRDEVTVASGEGVLDAGTVLGKLTTGGKYAASPATGSDGSQVGIAVLCYRVDATSADAQAVVISRAAQVKGPELIYDASVDDTAKTATKNDELAAAGIVVR